MFWLTTLIPLDTSDTSVLMKYRSKRLGLPCCVIVNINFWSGFLFLFFFPLNENNDNFDWINLLFIFKKTENDYFTDW